MIIQTVIKTDKFAVLVSAKSDADCTKAHLKAIDVVCRASGITLSRVTPPKEVQIKKERKRKHARNWSNV